MPCFINTNPAPLLGPHEFEIHYWFPDRCGQIWAIVNKDRVLPCPFRLTFNGAIQWALVPALFRIESASQIDAEHIRIWLNDIDDKWGVVPQSALFSMGDDEAREQLTHLKWIESIYRERISLFVAGSNSKTFDIRSGTFL